MQKPNSNDSVDFAQSAAADHGGEVATARHEHHAARHASGQPKCVRTLLLAGLPTGLSR